MSEIKITLHRVNGKVVYRAPEHKDAKAAVVETNETTKVVQRAINKAVAEDLMVPATKSTGTKLDQALAIYKGLSDRSRQNVIAVFIKQLDMTPAGASTYQYTCKKKLGA